MNPVLPFHLCENWREESRDDAGVSADYNLGNINDDRHINRAAFNFGYSSAYSAAPTGYGGHCGGYSGGHCGGAGAGVGCGGC